MAAITNTIRKIPLLTFKRNFSKEIQELPFLVTKGKEPILIIQGVKDFVTPPPSIASDEELIAEVISRLQKGGEYIEKHKRRIGAFYPVEPKPSLWQRIKKLATMKVG